MLALAAAPLGLRCHVYSPEKDSCAFDVVHAGTCAQYDDEASLGRFAGAVDVITYEFENVPAKTAAFLARRRPVLPDPQVLETTQDRLVEKNFISALKIATAPYGPVHSATQLSDGIAITGLPAVLKTRQLGYDGKGQAKIAKGGDPVAAWRSLHNEPCIVEGFIDFEREVSVVAARSRDGKVECFEVTENEHRDHILKISRVPAKVTPALANEARQIASRIAKAFDYVGVLAVEMFVVRKGSGAQAAGERNRSARAQFRPLDHRRRDGVAIRAAHPCGCGMAAGKACAPRQPRRNDEPDRPGNKRRRPLADGAGRLGPHLRQGRSARAPQDGTRDPRLARKMTSRALPQICTDVSLPVKPRRPI